MVSYKFGFLYAGKQIWETLKCLPHQTLYNQFIELGRLFPCGFHNSEGISRLVDSVK